MEAVTTGFNPDYTEDEPAYQQISKLTGDAVIEFGAPWCGHCQRAELAVREALVEYPNLRHIKVYDGKGKPLGRAFKVKLWPTLILLHDGVEVTRQVRPTRASQVSQLLAGVKK